ncbi:cytochrome C [Aliiruegeria sabulilitoris]|uniref:cytochrome C n=1 Tax=Aliiruegeria sabulilitoris TaxID=1510458 RepID=UPI000833DAFF|nr:cytochrome C [Aliiruegeria sabulilitoris]NDR56776.1 cytochrome C [Pseudoruegeria sp. M32A2M]
MRRIFLTLTLLLGSAGLAVAQDNAAAEAEPMTVSAELAAEKGCLSCHEGIEKFTEGVMMETIEALGGDYDDAAGCTVCHGGNVLGTTVDEAHAGAHATMIEDGGPQMFYPDPGSVWIADNTCGQSGCHEGYAERLTKSLMNTEAGKLQGNLWSWGVLDTHRSVYGNYDLVDEDGYVPTVGTDAYKEYMVAFAESHPDQMPDSMEQVPEVDVDQISEHPNLAGITYSRQQCQRCHVGVNGREKRGDYRGAGCSSCHVPYSNEGFYEGGDPTIAKDQPGKLLTHQLQATRKSKVKHGDIEYSGIPNETCSSCHNRGKRIGVSYQGIMEFPYGSPYSPTGGKQPKLHTKNYLFIKDDLHHQVQSREGNPEGGMLCQDCHTTVDMHGDGNMPGTTLAQVEIECEDCHGTVGQFPWELPLGYGEEFQQEIASDARGLADDLTDEQYFAEVYDAEDGYLLTARGNPFGNVVKKGSKVILHSASGVDFEIPVLKQIAMDGTWKSPNAEVAMMSVGKHMESMECYACHADWAPQCYGCHITVDYSEGKTDVDWITNANAREPNGLTADAPLGTNGLTSAGKVSETRSYLRWEEPTLGINGEGRVSPLMPGCQVITTVIDKDGNTVAHNEIWMTPDAGGTKGLDHAAVQPHTAGRLARTCESCHNNPKALGYGISGGRFLSDYTKGFVVDLETAAGEIIPGQHQFQSQPVPELDHDLSRIVTEDGQQLVTIGSHWPLTGPLPQEMREKMERTGLCMGCHQNMTNEELWNKVNSPEFVNNEEHQDVMDQAIHALADKKSE